MEVEPKIDELPLDVLLPVLLLLQHKHVVVEELLQLLVGEVDAQLLVGVHHKDLKTGDVKHSDEEVLASLHRCNGEEHRAVSVSAITSQLMGEVQLTS